MEIEQVLRRIDGRGYKAYKQLVGASQIIEGIRVIVTRVQSDPFAPPSVVKLEAPLELAPSEPIPFADLLHRKLFALFPRYSLKGAGEGKSGIISLPRPSNIVIPRSAVEVKGKLIVVRLWVGLPSRRRKILGDVASELLLERVPSLLKRAISSLSRGEIEDRVVLWRNQEFLRSWLKENNYTAFVADGSILPRACGSCEAPLKGAVPFEAPSRYAKELELPSGKILRGMVLRRLNHIVGPAFHGKTTLLEAIAEGVWNHVPGDGREYVVTLESSFYVESENGRWVSCVDLRAFLASLPGNRNLECFSTPDASGSTSIAATIQESVEIGVNHILVDEDNTATNFIHHDPLVEAFTGKKTIKPLTEVAPSMKERTGLTLVATGTPELFSVADEIIVMDEFRPRDGEGLRRSVSASRTPYVPPAKRTVFKAPRISKWKLRGRTLEIRNVGSVDLRPNRQLIECTQLRTASFYAIALAKPGTTAKRVKGVSKALKRWSYPFLKDPGPAFSYVRPVDIWFVLNRIPGVVFSRDR